jgi:type II secretory pathway component GspD/PulD (secretin)
MNRAILLLAVVGGMLGCDNGTANGGACTVLGCNGAQLSQAGGPVRQVTIEALIVETTQDFALQLGVDWDLTTTVQEDDGGIVGGVSADFNDILAQSAATGGAAGHLHLIPANHHPNSLFGVVWQNFIRGFTDTAVFVGAPPFSCFIVDGVCLAPLSGFPGIDLENLPARDPGLTGATFHTELLDDAQLAAILQTIEAQGGNEILSAPRVTLYNGQLAAITVQDFAPAVGRLTPEFFDAVTDIAPSPFGTFAGSTLVITPTITSDNHVILTLRPGALGVSAYLSQQFDADGNPSDLEFPILQTSRAFTDIEVADGETAFIGGLTRAGQTQRETGVPWLKDLPLVGLLFGDGDKFQDPDADLLIFITPRIIPD